MTSNEEQSRINELLQQEIHISRQLLGILQSENQALSSNDHDAIRRLIPDKQQAIDTMGSLAQQRQSLLKNAGFSEDKKGMEAFIRQCGLMSRDLLEQYWRQLGTAASGCQRQNEINGIIISASSRYTKNALSILKGQRPGNELHYGPNGEKISTANSTTFAKA